MQRHIATSSIATTKTLGSGRMALFYSNTAVDVIVHELGHLIDLSDVEKKGNLMNYTGGGTRLQKTKLNVRVDDKASFDTPEYQWDCLHDKTQCGDRF